MFFDNDDPGRKAAIAAANIFTPGKVKIFQGQDENLKDANDYLQAKKAGTLQKSGGKHSPTLRRTETWSVDVWDEHKPS